MSTRQTVRIGGLTPAQAGTGAIVLLAVGLLASVHQDRLFAAQRVRELTAQGKILAASVTAAIVFGDTATVQEHVSALRINPEVDAAAVYDLRGKLVASFAQKNSAMAPATPPEAAGTGVVVPVVHDVEQLGTVYIRPRLEPLGPRIMRHVPIMLLTVMAALLVGFMGASQRQLREANAQLESRAEALTETNRLLQIEMEERSNAEAALRQSQKMEAVGQLAGGVAHDFNNLLAIIQGNLHLLRMSDGSDIAAIHTYASAADVAADRAGHLVRRLLSFSRRQTLAPQVVELGALATGMSELIVHSVGPRVVIEWDLKATWKAFCDVNQMENVILNIAINARDAMPDGGTFTIATRDVSVNGRAGGPPIEEYVELRMRDTGTGMTEEVKMHAVNPFFSTKPHGQGTGLGLSTAFAFIRESNGSLEIESSPGNGTTIIIRLPRHIAADKVTV